MKTFVELYEAYNENVFRFLWKLCGGNVEIAEEITQETFFHAYLGITKFREESSVTTWLLTIAKNQYFMFLRKKSNRETVYMDELIADIVDITSSDISDEVSDKQLISDSLDIVLSLSENMKSVFISRIYYDMQYSEIAKQLSISESSAKVLFHRAKLLLREKLKEDYGYEI